MSGRPTALISGVTGQDGILLARSLRRDGFRVVGTRIPGGSSDRLVYLDGVEVIDLDLRDAAGWRRLIAGLLPDLVFHLAAVTSVAESWQQPKLTADLNTAATEQLIELIAHHAPTARTFVASSAEIFGPSALSPQTEATEMDPRSPYAESKAAVRQLAADARNRGQFVSAGLLYPHESVLRAPSFVTRKITWAAAEIALDRRESLSLGNVAITRDWGAATDVVAAMRLIMHADWPDEFIVATGSATSLSELVEYAFAAANLADPWQRIVIDPALLRPADPQILVGDAGKLRRTTGWRPVVPVASVIADMVAADRQRITSARSELSSLLD